MSVVRRQMLVVTPSIDSDWAATANPANLTDGNLTTEIQVNDEVAIRHWARLDFNVPVKLSSLSVRARGGGAGCGATTWITSNGQVVTAASQAASTDFTVNFNSTFVTWVRVDFTSSRSNFDGFGEIAPNYASPPTVRGIIRRIAAAKSQKVGAYGAAILRRDVVAITPSIDTSWTTNDLNNLLDNNVNTEIQANNQSVVGHWVQLSFSPPLRLVTLHLRARAGGAGSGACTWVTSDSQSQANGSMAPSAEASLVYNGNPVTYVRGTWTGARTNFDGWGEIWASGPVDSGNVYLGGYAR